MSQESSALSAAGATVSESISAIRTVAAFRLEQQLLDVYDRALQLPRRNGIKRGVVGGTRPAPLTALCVG